MPETHNYHHPKVDPYRHQEFPKMVYNHKRSRPSSIEERVDPKTGQVYDEHIPGFISFKIVKDEEALQAALEAGFSVEPPAQHSAAQVEEVEGDESPRRSRKGR